MVSGVVLEHRERLRPAKCLLSGQRLIIIIFDKDFGYLTFGRMTDVPFGVILLRISIKSLDHIFKMLKWILFESGIKFERKFVSVTESKGGVIPLD